MSLLSFGPVLHFAKIADQEDFSGRYETWDRRTAIPAFQPALARKGRPQGRPRSGCGGWPARRVPGRQSPEAPVLELHHIADARDDRIDLDLADLCAVQLDIGIDVDPAQIGADRGAVRNPVIAADMRRQPPAVFHPQVAAGQRAARIGVVKPGKVDADADKGLELRRGVKVVLQRNHRRQLLDLADLGPVGLDRVAKGQGGQNLDAQIVADEIFEGDRRARAVADIGRDRAPGQIAIVRFRVHIGDAQTQGPIPLRLGECGGARAQTQGGQRRDGQQVMFHNDPHRLEFGRTRRFFPARDFDLHQPVNTPPRPATNGRMPWRPEPSSCVTDRKDKE